MSRNNSFFTLDLLVLSVLMRGDNYGYGISTMIEEESNGSFKIKEGVLYPILYKLNKKKMISSYEVPINRRIRVYYKIEKEGVEELANLVEDFYSGYEAIDSLIKSGRETHE